MSEQIESYVRNCYIKSRDGEALFTFDGATVTPQLDGYAIIPNEDYEASLQEHLTPDEAWQAGHDIGRAEALAELAAARAAPDLLQLRKWAIEQAGCADLGHAAAMVEYVLKGKVP